jgi:hypothetical protein
MVHGQHEKSPVKKNVPQNNLMKKDQFIKMGLILYSEGQQLGAVPYLIFSACHVAEPSGQNRVNHRNVAIT